MALPQPLDVFGPNYRVDTVNLDARYDPALALNAARQEAAARFRELSNNTPPREDDYAVPHYLTFASVWNWQTKYYYTYYDESQIDSLENSIAMRRDGFIQELLWHRQLPTVSLGHALEVDDPDDPGQVDVRRQLGQVVGRIPYFQRMKLQLLESLFYGKSGSQILWGKKRIGGREYTTVVSHMPVNGDKIAYDWDCVPGVFIYKGSSLFSDPEAQALIKNLDRGPAIFLRTPYYRDRFVVHEFQPADTDYLFESEKAASVHGLGIRDRMYWAWNMRAQVLGWYLAALERVGVNGMLYAYYPTGNPEARDAVLRALKDFISTNVAAFPRALGDPTSLIDRIEASSVGYEVMYQMLTHLEGIMRRAVLGQNLSSQSGSTGLGSGVADLQGQSKEDIVLYDSSCLAETIDEQLVKNILKYNFWEYEGKTYRGDDLPFGVKFTLQADRQNVTDLIQSAQALYQMGVPLDSEDLRERVGLTAPRSKATTLVMQQPAAPGQPGQIGDPAAHAAAEVGGPQGGPGNPPAAPGQAPGEDDGPTSVNRLMERYAAHPDSDTLYDAACEVVATVDSDYLRGAWWDAERCRAWVSLFLSAPEHAVRDLRVELAAAIGINKFTITCEQEPSGDRWSPMDLDRYEMYSSFDESKHPREGKGRREGGRFARKGSSDLSGTKVVGKDGKPLTVYHGTEAGDIDEFRPGTFFSERKAEARAYAELTDTNNDTSIKYQDVKENGVSEERLREAFDEGGWSTYQDYEGEPNVVDLNGNSLRFFYWDGTTSGYGDKNIVILSGVKVGEDEKGRITGIEYGPTDDDEGREPREVPRRVYSVNLDIKNPVKLPWDEANVLGRRLGGTDEYINETINKYKSEGYDGIETVSDDAPDVRQWVIFDPSQVHLAGEPEKFAADPETYASATYDETKHARGGKGTKEGGKFVKKGTRGTPLAPIASKPAPLKPLAPAKGPGKAPGGPVGKPPASKVQTPAPAPAAPTAGQPAGKAAAQKKGAPPAAGQPPLSGQSESDQTVAGLERELLTPQEKSKIQALVARIKAAPMISTKAAIGIIGSEKPEYLDDVEKFMSSQKARLQNGQIRARDIAKALLITIASQGSSGNGVTTFLNKIKGSEYHNWLTTTDEGKWFAEAATEKSPKTGQDQFRPEDIAAGWFLSPLGRRAMDNLDAGQFNPDDFAEFVQVRKAFGDDRISTSNVLGVKEAKTSKKLGLKDVHEVAQEISNARGDSDKIGAALARFKGIGLGKTGFIKHFLGVADTSTVDAVQINFWLTGKGDVRDDGSEEARLVAEIKEHMGNTAVSQAITSRIKYRMGLLDKHLTEKHGQSINQHILHHWLWDAARGSAVKHLGMYMGYTLHSSEGDLEFMAADPCGDGGGEPGFHAGNTCAAGGSGGGTATAEKSGKFGKAKAKIALDPNYTDDDVKGAIETVFGDKAGGVDYETLATLAGATDNAEVVVYGYHDTIFVQSIEKDGNGDQIYSSQRTISRAGDGPNLYNEIFVVSEKYQRQGIGLEVFGRQIEEASRLGLKEIDAYAARVEGGPDAKPMNGYYTWPRFGYDAKLPLKMLKRLPNGLKRATKVSDLMRTPAGRKWWKENGEGMDMTFSLRPGSLSLKVWEAYMKEREAKGWRPRTSSPTTTKSSTPSGTTSENLNNPEYPELYKYEPSGDPGVYLMLPLPIETAVGLAVDGGEPATELHVTLAYLGKLSKVGHEGVARAREICALYAAATAPVEAEISGVGRFTTPKGDAFYLSVDSPSLGDIRRELCDVLASVGLDHDRKHGFTPHITLKYLDKKEKSPLRRFPVESVTFGGLALSVGGHVSEYPFGTLKGGEAA